MNVLVNNVQETILFLIVKTVAYFTVYQSSKGHTMKKHISINTLVLNFLGWSACSCSPPLSSALPFCLALDAFSAVGKRQYCALPPPTGMKCVSVFPLTFLMRFSGNFPAVKELICLYLVKIFNPRLLYSFTTPWNWNTEEVHSLFHRLQPESLGSIIQFNINK